MRGEKIDAKARAQCNALGWAVHPQPSGRFLASKRVIQEDHSETFMYESAYTLEALAKIVKRREREEATSRRPR